VRTAQAPGDVEPRGGRAADRGDQADRIVCVGPHIDKEPCSPDLLKPCGLLGPDDWQELSGALLSRVEEFVAQHESGGAGG
jgi:hypothetical protein